MLYMRSAEEDRTARAVIRDEALRLFAAHGPDAVTVRQIAAAAGVSPALVVHHFGSKEGLREAVDQHVLGLFEALIGEMTAEGAPDLYDPAATGSLAEAIVRHLPPGSPVPGYLRRLLLAELVMARGQPGEEVDQVPEHDRAQPRARPDQQGEQEHAAPARPQPPGRLPGPSTRRRHGRAVSPARTE